MFKLEWDEAKRNWTLAERKLDFADVARIDWDSAITLEDVCQTYAETRYITYAHLHGRLCVLALCYRAGAIRVISLRKANAREVRNFG